MHQMYMKNESQLKENPVLVTDSLCLSQESRFLALLLAPGSRQISSGSNAVSSSLSSVSFTDYLCLSQTVCVCNIQSVSVTDSLCLSQNVCVFHRLSVLTNYILFLQNIVIWVCPSECWSGASSTSTFPKPCSWTHYTTLHLSLIHIWRCRRRG